ncbi:MAG: hypothetical protein KIG60_09145 [Caryophanon sp.]|nr:hypothetical protein [Caryophanon sp.]
MAKIESTSLPTVSARTVVKSDTELLVYGTATGTTAFVVNGEDNKKAIVNITVTKAAGQSYKVETDVVDHNVVDHTTSTIAANAQGKSVVRIEGQTLYAIGEGTVDLAIDGSTTDFYRISVVKDDVTGLYKFSKGTVVKKSVFTAEDLGLTVIETATSSNEDIATVEKTTDKITLTTQGSSATGKITVTGPQGTSYVYIKKDDSTFTAVVEKSEPILLSETGLTNIKEKSWSNADIARTVEAGTNVQFFVLQDGNTAYKAVDDAGNVTLVNVPVTENAAGHREIIPEIVEEVLGAKNPDNPILADSTPEDASVVTGDSVRIHGSNVYATKLGKTVIKLSDDKLVEYDVTIENGIYSIAHKDLTNGVAVNDTEIDLNGNLTVVEAPDTAIATIIAKGKQLIVTGQATGTTSAVIQDGTKKVRVVITVATDNTVTVEPLKVELAQDETVTEIHAEKTNARIDKDKKAIYAFETGTFEYISKDASNVETVQQLNITKNGTAYTVASSKIASEIYEATDLGLTNTLQIEAGYAQSVVRATVVNDRLVLYKVGVGNTDVVVTDGNGQKTVIHVSVTADDFTPTIARKDTPFEAAAYSFAADKAITATVNNPAIASVHADGNLYLFSVGTTYATLVSDGEKALAKITVVKTGNKLEATITPIKKTAAELAIGATTVTALPSDSTTVGTDASIVRVEDNVVYAVGKGTTVVKLNDKIVKLTVAEADNAYTMTVDDVVSFIELPIGEGTFTVADITNNSAVKVLLDNNETVVDKTDDQLIIYTTATNGNADILITTGTGDTKQSTLYHITVSNGVITKTDAVTNNITGGTTVVAGADNVELRLVDSVNKFYLLKEGKAALTGTNGLVNLDITRDFTTKQFKATQEVVNYTLKEALTLPTGEATFTVNDKVLTAVSETAGVKTFYTNNYRVEASTQLLNNQYELAVAERHFNKVDTLGYGLTLTGTTIHSEDEGIAKAEVVTIDGTNNGTKQLIIYAGDGTVAGTTNITVTEGTKKLTIKVTRAADGTLTHEIIGTADAVKFGDLGLTLTDGAITVEGHDEAYVQANVTANGISLSAQATGTTSLLVKQSGETKAIINIRVADGKVIPSVVKYTGALTEVITGDASTTHTRNGEMYAVKEGVVLYANNTEAVQLRITKNSETNLYSITPATFKLTSTITNLDLVPDADTVLTVSNSSVADVYKQNDTLYVVAKSLGYTDVLMTQSNGKKAVIHVNSKADAITAKVSPTAGTGYVGNNSIQEREGKLYALQVGTSTIKRSNDVLVNATVTRNATTNEFDSISLADVKYGFDKEVTLVGDAANILIVDPTDNKVVLAKAAGSAQVVVDNKLRNVTVTKEADGTHSIEVAPAQEQLVLKAEDLGLTLSDTTTIVATAITGSNSVKAEVIGSNIYVSAIGIGKSELTIDGKTVVYVDVTAENNVPKFKEHHIAKAEITEATVLSPVESSATIVRLDGKKLYALTEGVELVKGTLAGGDALYKVVATRENNKLTVTPTIIKKSLPGVTSATAIPDDADHKPVVRVAGDGEIVAVGIGTTIFDIDSTKYRVNVSAEGDMTVDVLATTTIDLKDVLPENISGTVNSSLLAVTKSGKELNVIAENEGTELLQVTDGTNTVYVKVVVTKDGSNNYSVAYEVVKTVITASTLGFVPATIDGTIPNGIVKVENGEVIVYPGTGLTPSYFTVKSSGAEQALYKLTTSGVTLVDNVATGYEVATFSTLVSVTDLGIVPKVVAIDGTVRTAVEGEQLRIIATNAGKSHVIVQGENDTYKVIDVDVNTSPWEITPVIQNTLKLDAVTKEALYGPIKAITDTVKNRSILYATGAGKIAYENNGFLYNSEVVYTAGKYTFAAPVKVNVADVDSTEELTVLQGTQSVVAKETSYVATKTGVANYRSVKDDVTSYKEVTVEEDANQFKATAKTLAHTKLPATAISAEIIKAPATVYLDGTTIYGNAAVDEDIIVSTKDADGKVTIYTAKVAADGATIKYEFVPLTLADKVATSWEVNASTIQVSNPAVARIENNTIYFVGQGETAITFTSPTGVKRTIEYKVTDNYEVEMKTDEGNTISYTEERFEENGQDTIYFTFAMNVPTVELDAGFLIGSYPTATNGVTQIDEVKFKLPKPVATISDIWLIIPEYGYENEYEFKLSFDDVNNKAILEQKNPDAAGQPVFKLIKSTN